MNNIWTICQREFKSYFNSPIYYVVSILLFFSGGVIFTYFAFQVRRAEVSFLWPIIIILSLVLPLLSIKLISEEKNKGTIELLLTSPISSFELVMGKYLSVLILWFFIYLGMWLYPIALILFSNTGPDYGVVFSSYIGLFLYGTALLAIGMVASAISPNQVVAAFLTMFIVVFLLFFHLLLGELHPTVRAVVMEIAPINHLQDFMKGIFDFRHLIYYLLWSSMAVLFCNIAVNSHSWKK